MAQNKPNPVPRSPLQLIKRRRIFLAIMCALIAIVAAFAARPIYKLAKGWRARHIASQADKFIEEKKWDEALNKAQAAYLLKSDEPAAIRVVAKLQTATAPPDALPFWQELLKTGKSTSEDRRNYAELLLRLGSLKVAELQIKHLLADDPNNPQNLRMAAQLVGLQGNYAESLKFASAANKKDPDNQAGKLLLSSLQVDSLNPQIRAQGWEDLWALAGQKDNLALEALVFMSQRADLPWDKEDNLIDLLKNHPLAEETHRLMAIEREIRIHPSRRDELLDQVISERKNEDPEGLRNFGVWLNRQEAYQRTLTTLPLELSIKRKDLFLVYLDAMAGLGQWNEIMKLFENKNLPLEEVYVEIFLARCLSELGDPENADIHWRRAHLAALKNKEHMWFLANYAEKSGYIAQSERALRTLTTDATGSRAAYLALLNIATREDDTYKMRDLLKEMLVRWPEDSAVQNDYAYFNALLNERVGEARDIALKLVAQSPANLPHRTTLALAYYRLNDHVAALNIYGELLVPWDQSPLTSRVVYATILAANGKIDEAQRLLKTIPLENLRKEEKALLDSW